MEPTNDSMTCKGPQSVNRRPSGGIPASEVFGFPVSANQYTVLQPAESHSQVQKKEGSWTPEAQDVGD